MDKLNHRIHFARLGLTLVLVLCPSVLRAQDYGSIRQRKIERAYQQLVHAKIFNLGGYGWGMTISAEERAFRTLLESSNSTALLKKLLQEANPEGQMYSLYGLYLNEPAVFQSELERMKSEDGPAERWEEMTLIEKGKIRTAVGCSLFRQDRQALITTIASGEFDQAFKSSSARLASK
ncbi:MAG TPA: hypothetical protein DC054_09610 [Blastocatellia bacterium]|nr:hypothetical protein [Blastocatellia bacterium]